MNGPGSRAILAILAAAVVVAGLSLGNLVGQLVIGPSRPAPSATPIPSTVAIPPADADGEEIEGLPRYPGAVRTSFTEDDLGSAVLRSAVYLVRADRDDVRAFYIEAFEEHGWTIADLGFELDTWTFVVEAPPREAMVEIETRGDVVAVRLEIMERSPTPAPEAPPPPTPAPTAPPPPVAPPPADDGDDDDDDDGDGDDDTDDD